LSFVLFPSFLPSSLSVHFFRLFFTNFVLSPLGQCNKIEPENGQPKKGKANLCKNLGEQMGIGGEGEKRDCAGKAEEGGK
jgi:hypothetical protein